MAILVEGIRVDGVFFARAHRVDLVNKCGEVFGKGRESICAAVDGWDRNASLVEQIARCSKYVSEIVVAVYHQQGVTFEG